MTEFGTAYQGGGITPEQLAMGAGNTLQSAVFDLVAGTTVLIGTTATTYGRARIMHRAVTCVAIDTPGTAAVISIGTNAPNYDNIIPTLTLTGLDTANEYLQGTIQNGTTIAPGTAVYAKLVTPTDGTALTVQVELEVVYQGV